MKCPAALALAAALLAGGCVYRLEVEVDDPIPTGALGFQPGRTPYGEVLSRLGPPSEIEPTAEGFVLRYHTFRAGEWLLEARYRQGKLAYSFGSGDFGTLALDFDGEGTLRGYSRTTGPLDRGWGAIVGHSRSPELFFRNREYAPLSPIHRWGEELDRSPGG